MPDEDDVAAVTKLCHNCVEQIDVALEPVGVLSRPFGRTFSQTECGTVIGDDVPELAERFHDLPPGKNGRPEPVQQDEYRRHALTVTRVRFEPITDIDTVERCEFVFRTRQFAGRLRSRRFGGEEKRNDEERDNSRNQRPCHEPTKSAHTVRIVPRAVRQPVTPNGSRWTYFSLSPGFRVASAKTASPATSAPAPSP